MSRIIISLLLISFTAIGGEIKVQTRTDGTLVCEKIENQAGNLKLYPKADQKFNRLVSIADVSAVIQQEPDLVKFLKNAFNEGKYSAVSSEKGVTILQENYHTGWGKRTAFHIVMSMVNLGKFTDAESVFKTGLIQIPGENEQEDQLLLKLAGSYLEVMKKSGAFTVKDLDKIKVPESELGKTFYYKLQGILYEQSAKPSLAVLSYYKGILLGVKNYETKLIQSRIEAIYMSQGDPRVLPDLSKID